MHAGDGVKYPARRQKKGKKGPSQWQLAPCKPLCKCHTAALDVHLNAGCVQRVFRMAMQSTLGFLDWVNFYMHASL